MKKLKSHFWYTKHQRNGILFLLAIIFVTQLAYHFVDFEKNNHFDFQQSEILEFQKKIDSLKQVELEKRKPKIYPFNPNFITDYKGYQLGMSIQEIDRLLAYRKRKLFVNSAKEFQKITKISDSLLTTISPYFKFPDWVNQKRYSKDNKRKFNNKVEKNAQEITTSDLNLANQNDFLAIKGVDENLSNRIIKYRKKLNGFSISGQLSEVWGMSKEVEQNILNTFSIQSKPEIQKININTASFKEVLKIPYIDYELCKKVFELRDEVAELQSISELKNIEGFPLEKYDKITLYLLAK